MFQFSDNNTEPLWSVQMTYYSIMKLQVIIFYSFWNLKLPSFFVSRRDKVQRLGFSNTVLWSSWVQINKQCEVPLAGISRLWQNKHIDLLICFPPVCTGASRLTGQEDLRGRSWGLWQQLVRWMFLIGGAGIVFLFSHPFIHNNFNHGCDWLGLIIPKQCSYLSLIVWMCL